MEWLFRLRGELTSRQKMMLSSIGLLIFFAIWFILTMGEKPIVTSGILPAPLKVLSSYGDLCSDNDLIKNAAFSMGLNIAGYLKAIFYSLIFGFAIGLFPVFRGLFQSHLDAIRYIPLAAATSLFIVWFGIGVNMKVNFLAFGIIIFLLPIVVQRIDEVKDVYLKTVHTLGATDWQIIKTVYIPSVVSRLFDDVRILTAISWTYIVVAEGLGSQGGLGNLIFAAKRVSRIDKLFALLLLIIIIGVIQDLVFRYLDREFFPFKYQTKEKYSNKIKEPKIFDVLMSFVFSILVWILLGVYFIFIVAEFSPDLLGVQPLSYFFGDTVWGIHTIFAGVLIYKGYKLYGKYIVTKAPATNSEDHG